MFRVTEAKPTHKTETSEFLNKSTANQRAFRLHVSVPGDCAGCSTIEPALTAFRVRTGCLGNGAPTTERRSAGTRL